VDSVLQHRAHFIPCHAGKPVQKFLDLGVVFQIPELRRDRHARLPEQPITTIPLGYCLTPSIQNLLTCKSLERIEANRTRPTMLIPHFKRLRVIDRLKRIRELVALRPELSVSFRSSALLITALLFSGISTSESSRLHARQPSADTSLYQPRTLASVDIARDLKLLRQSLEQVHAGYDRYAPRRVMDAAFARLNRQTATPMTDVALYREVALLLAKIRCNHTKAEYPAALQKYRETHDTHLPFRVRMFGQRMFVDTSASATLAHGTEIVSINGVTADSIIVKLSRFAAVDGYTDFARTTLLERDSDLMGSDLDHYWPIEFGFSKTWNVETIDASGKRGTSVLAPISYTAWQSLGGNTVPLDFANGTHLALHSEASAVLTIRSFVNYRTPVNADSLYRSLFSQLRKRRVQQLVIDLRDNGGGSDNASNALLPYLIDMPVQPVKASRRRTITIDPSLRASFSTWGDANAVFAPADSLFAPGSGKMFVERAANQRFRPAAERFTGRVSVLTSKRRTPNCQTPCTSGPSARR